MYIKLIYFIVKYVSTIFTFAEGIAGFPLPRNELIKRIVAVR